MNNLLIASIIERIGEKLGNEIRLIPDSFDFSNDQTYFDQTFFKRSLKRIGESKDIHFIEKELSIEGLLESASVSPLPIICFNQNHQPVLVEKSGKHVNLYKYHNGEWDVEIENITPNNICPLLCKAKAFNLEPTNNKIFCLFPIFAPSTSTQTLDNPNPTPIKRLIQLLKAEKKHISYIYIYAILVGFLSLTLPLGVQSIIGMVSGGLVLRPVILLSILVVIGTFMAGMLQIMQMSIVEAVQQRIFTRTAIDFAQRIPKIKLEVILNKYAPELINRFFDVLTVQKGMSKLLTDFVTSLLQILFGLLLLSFYHPFFVFFSILLLLILFLIFYFTGKRGLVTSLHESKYKYKIAHWLSELARNFTTFKLAGHIQMPLAKVEALLTGYLNKRASHFKVLIGQYSSIVFFKTFVTGGVLILGSTLVVERQITVGQFVASEIVIITVIAAVEKMILQLDNVYDILTAVEKLGDVTDLPLEDNSQTVPYRHENDLGFDVNIKDLCYKYPDGNAVLQNVNLHIQSGGIVAITGAGASGKTTLLKIVMGMLQEFKGSVSLNGFSIRDLNSISFRNYMGDCLSHDEIFDGNFLENITLNRNNISSSWLKEVLKICELSDFINQMPDGLHSHLSAGGEGIPSSICKKIVLARTLIKKPKLILFDDFFYNLENDFKVRMLETIFDKSRFSWSILAISHDPLLLSKADKIIILDKGTISYSGHFSELKNKPSFRKLISIS